ncbi:MAG: Cof-type HAD-IIB family hydrolase [Lachnospiraceae bacterium]|nr:Cof-type HAD-IIB family hydrolase [Lachnospiraceae bacterium]
MSYNTDIKYKDDIMEKKEIKVIGLDLDGTLLDPDKKISEFTFDTLKEASERGIEIVPSTGRYFSAMPACIREMPFVHYSININGASVADVRTGEKLYTAEIPLSEALDIMRYLDTKPALYDCYMNDHGWITGSFKDRVESFVQDPHYIDMVRNLRDSVPELKAFITEKGRDIQKIQFFTYDHDFQQETLHHGAELFPDIICTSSVRDENVEFNNIHANKGDALCGLAVKLGYTRENTMAFGDGDNDIPMIKAAAVGVAMSNSCEDALKAADFIALSNAEDGVAKFIREYCF